MKKLGIILLIMGISSSANAGLYGLTIHSRANCINNESISWDRLSTWSLLTVSTHYYYNQPVHVINNGWEATSRSAAVHWGEGTGGWTVVGEHWRNLYGKIQYLGSEIVSDCSIYDGWWD